MLANKVSPASLCSNSLSGESEMNAITQGLGGGEGESQQSQMSLFGTSGSSELTSSVELFSQPASLSCHSQHSQSEPSSHLPSSHTLHGGQSQDEGRGSHCIQLDRARAQHQSQNQQHNKYYMRYLSAVSGPLSKRHLQQEGEASTPLAVGGAGRQGDSVHSKAAFDKWKQRQQDKLDKQKLIEEVVTHSATGYTKELKDTLESLRKDIKEALSSQTEATDSNEAVEKSELERESAQNMLHQLTQGQAEIRGELRDLRTLCSQQKMEIAELKEQLVAAGEHQTRAIQSALSTEITKLGEGVMRPCLQELQVRVSEMSEQLKTYHTQWRAGVRETESGGRPQKENCPPTNRDACVPALNAPMQQSHQNHKDCGDDTRGQWPRNSQIRRKRKGQREQHPQPTTTSTNSRRDSHSKTVTGRELESQSSTGGRSTSCDIDLTQHSPEGCSQVISSSIQQLRQSQPTSNTAAKPPSPVYRAPAAKRKRAGAVAGGGGRVGKQQRGRGRLLLATPRITRRSQRLGRPPSAQLSRQNPTRARVEQEEPRGGLTETERRRERGERGDVLDDWLDFRPPTACHLPSRPVSGFQRSSEAARRRLAVTEKMSSTLAGSDSVLRELFSSAPSILSP